MKVIVCGGRDLSNDKLVWTTLDKVLAKYESKLAIIHGACPTGADHIAEEWAKAREVAYIGIPAKWTARGRAAGPERNKRMRDATGPDACIAFPGGPGTQNMIKLMREIGIEPWLVGWKEAENA